MTLFAPPGVPALATLIAGEDVKREFAGVMSRELSKEILVA